MSGTEMVTVTVPVGQFRLDFWNLEARPGLFIEFFRPFLSVFCSVVGHIILLEEDGCFWEYRYNPETST